VSDVLDEEGEVLRVRVFVLHAGGQLLEHVGPAETVGDQPLRGKSSGREGRVAPSGGLLGLHIEQQAEDADRSGGSHFSAANAARPFPASRRGFQDPQAGATWLLNWGEHGE